MPKHFLNTPVQIDARKLQTQARLLAALIEIQDSGRPFTALTVSQLCQQANVSRATFYRHHKTIQDVIAVGAFDLLFGFERTVDAKPGMNFTEGSALLVNLIHENRAFFNLVIWSQNQPLITSIFVGEVEKIMLNADNSPSNQRFISQFLGTAILNFALQVAQNPVNESETLRLFRLLIPDL